MSKINLNKKEIKIILDDNYLTDRQKDIFELYYLKGWVAEDVGAELKRSRITIYRELKEIRKKIDEILNENDNK